MEDAQNIIIMLCHMIAAMIQNSEWALLGSNDIVGIVAKANRACNGQCRTGH